MLVDVVIAALIVGAGVWGYRRGVSTRMLVAAGFAVGALVGSRLAPLVLSGGPHHDFAPAVALPAALILGAAVAAVMERVARELEWSLRQRYRVDVVAGAALGVFVALAVVWAVAAVGGRVETVKASQIVGGLNSVLPSPGPALDADKPPSRPLRARPRSPAVAAGLRMKRDPQVKSAARSVVKIAVRACGRGGAGSGWIAGDGVVMTNAHVVHQSSKIGVRIQGKGRPLEARPIYYDEADDVAILRVPEARGRPWLRVNPTPKVPSVGAALGFPFGGRFKIRATLLGPLFPLPPDTTAGTPGHPARFLRSGLGLGPGISGGPVVDPSGRVVAMIFAGGLSGRRRDQTGIPGPVMQSALRRALASPRVVETGDCGGGGQSQ